jgi:alpha-1,2-mannosyltransferase
VQTAPGTTAFGGPATVAAGSWRSSQLRRWSPAAFSAALAIGLSLYLALRSYQVDIDVYRMGGRHVLSGDLYSVHFGTLFFTYTPFAALVFALPALNLAISSMQRLWAITNVVALCGFIYVSIRAVLPGIERRRVLRWSLLLLAPAIVLDPVFVNVGLGQINLVLCLLIAWDLLGDRRIGRVTIPLGIATGIASAIKLTPLIFVPYLLLTRRARGATNATLTFVLCEAVAFAASPRASLTFWTRDVLDAKRAGALLYTSDQNLSSVLERLVHGPVGLAVELPLAVCIGTCGLALGAYAHKHSSPMLGLLVCATTGLVISPITWVHHLVWVVPALIWLAVAADRPAGGRVIAGAATLLFVVAPIWWVPTSYLPSTNPPELHEKGWELVAGNSFFFAMALFLAWIATMLFLRHRASVPHSPDRNSPDRNSPNWNSPDRNSPERNSPGGHLDELQNGSPIASGGSHAEAFLEEGVV